jgi:multimeric flavodoxin WrbA
VALDRPHMDDAVHPSDRPRVVAVLASPRRGGNTEALVAATLERLTAFGCRCETIALSRLRLAACDGHDDCAERSVCAHRDDAAEVLDAVYAADGLLLATPVYYENVSAQMKLFMDRNYFAYMHERRLPANVVGLIAVTAETGLDETLAALRRYVALSTTGDVPTYGMSGCADERGAARGDPELLEAARRLAADMASHLLPSA